VIFFDNMIREIYHDEDGYWVNTEKGYQATGMDFESHTIHVDTSKAEYDNTTVGWYALLRIA
jgi:hypothetical protein